MPVFFAIVAFLVFQLGHCLLCLYLIGSQRHRRLVRGGLASVF